MLQLLCCSCRRISAIWCYLKYHSTCASFIAPRSIEDVQDLVKWLKLGGELVVMHVVLPVGDPHIPVPLLYAAHMDVTVCDWRCKTLHGILAHQTGSASPFPGLPPHSSSSDLDFM